MLGEGAIPNRKGQNLVRKYLVTITETLEMELELSAKNAAHAEEMARDGYRLGSYILDASHFTDVDFNTKPIQRERDAER